MSKVIGLPAIALIVSGLACGSLAGPTGVITAPLGGTLAPTGTPTGTCHRLTAPELAYMEAMTPITLDLDDARTECNLGGPACLTRLRQVESSLSEVEPPQYFRVMDDLFRQLLDLYIASAEAEQAGDYAGAIDLLDQASAVRQQGAAEMDRLRAFVCE
jgi:hypothetical protein